MTRAVYEVPPVRLTVVMTHPVQYVSPWFRWIAEHEARLDLTVVYATTPTPAQQGTGFSQAFAWDVPLTDGYAHEVLHPASEMDVDFRQNDLYRVADTPSAAACCALCITSS